MVIGYGTETIKEGAFADCTSLSNITIPDSVTTIGNDAFKNTSWYNSQDDGVVYLGKIAYKYKGTMPANTNIELKDGTVLIADGAFLNQNLTGIEIPHSVTKIGKDAFSGCMSLSSITLSNNINYIGEAAFANCTSLSNIVIWKNVDEIGYRTFEGWQSTQTINVEANQVPSRWNTNWNYKCNANIVYAYTGK